MVTANSTRGTLTEEAHRRIEEMIVTLEIAPGEVVSETILSNLTGIGTTPIREALQQLAREHLVDIFPRRGVVVTNVDVREQLEVLETRRAGPYLTCDGQNHANHLQREFEHIANCSACHPASGQNAGGGDHGRRPVGAHR